MARGSLLQRGAGLVFMLVVLVLLDPSQGGILHRLVLPIMALIASALILRNIMAVALATGALTTLAINLNGDVYQAQVYPLLALLAFLVLAILTFWRFKTHIRSTHKQRWLQRRHKPPK